MFGFFKSRPSNRALLVSARQKMSDCVSDHLSTLAVKRSQGIRIDDYGKVDGSKWIKECQHFMDRVVRPLLTEEEAQALYDVGFNDVCNELLEAPVRRENARIEAQSSYDDKISPTNFEQFCADELAKAGWRTSLTKGSGDQGVDVIAKRNGTVLVVQCKKYGQPVGNAAVQEVIAAKAYMRAKYAAVITNASYTKSAIELASSTDVLLLHHTEIPQINRKLS